MSDDRANKMTFMLLMDGIAPAVVGGIGVVTVVVSLSKGPSVVDTSTSCWAEVPVPVYPGAGFPVVPDDAIG